MTKKKKEKEILYLQELQYLNLCI